MIVMFRSPGVQLKIEDSATEYAGYPRGLEFSLARVTSQCEVQDIKYKCCG